MSGAARILNGTSSARRADAGPFVFEYAGRLHLDRLLAGIVTTEHGPKQKRMREWIAATNSNPMASRG